MSSPRPEQILIRTTTTPGDLGNWHSCFDLVSCGNVLGRRVAVMEQGRKRRCLPAPENIPDDGIAAYWRALYEREHRPSPRLWPDQSSLTYVEMPMSGETICAFCTTCREVAGVAKQLRLRRPDLSLQNNGITWGIHRGVAVAPACAKPATGSD